MFVFYGCYKLDYGTYSIFTVLAYNIPMALCELTFWSSPM